MEGETRKDDGGGEPVPDLIEEIPAAEAPAEGAPAAAGAPESPPAPAAPAPPAGAEPESPPAPPEGALPATAGPAEGSPPAEPEASEESPGFFGRAALKLGAWKQAAKEKGSAFAAGAREKFARMDERMEAASQKFKDAAAAKAEAAKAKAAQIAEAARRKKDAAAAYLHQKKERVVDVARRAGFASERPEVLERRGLVAKRELQVRLILERVLAVHQPDLAAADPELARRFEILAGIDAALSQLPAPPGSPPPPGRKP